MDISKLELSEDRILVLPDQSESVDASGLYVPRETSNSGEVVLVGKGKQAEDTGAWIDMYVEKGDKVIIDRFAAIAFGEYLLLKQTGILVFTNKVKKIKHHE